MLAQFRQGAPIGPPVELQVAPSGPQGSNTPRWRLGIRNNATLTVGSDAVWFDGVSLGRG